jgi:hypothetical protein
MGGNGTDLSVAQLIDRSKDRALVVAQGLSHKSFQSASNDTLSESEPNGLE